MITFILKLLVLIYLFYMIKCVYEMVQYNTSSDIIILDKPTKDKVIEELKRKSPLSIKLQDIPVELTIETMNYRIPGYIIKDGDSLISLDQLSKSDAYNIHKNAKLITDYQLNDYSDSKELFSDYMTCGTNRYLSLYKGAQYIPLTKNYRETLLLQSIEGSIIIYLFNFI